MSSVFDEFSSSAALYPERPFLHIPALAASAYSASAVDYSYREMATAVAALAAEFAAAGYRCGHRLGLMLENRAEFFSHWLALNQLGVSVVPLNSEMQPDELAYLIEHSEIESAVALEQTVALLQQANQLLAAPIAIVTPAQLAELPAPRRAGSERRPDSASECALLYTSGSTGKPKGCILTNQYFTAFGAWYRDAGGLCQLEPGVERLLTPLPLVHMNAMAVSTMGMLMTGGCVIQLDRFHPSSWWQSVRDSGATIVHYLGVLPAILLNLPASANDDCRGRVKFGFGAGVNPKHHAAFEQRFGFPLLEAWAMTESGCGGTIIANREPRHVGSCCFGKPSAAVEYKLIDEQRREVAAGQPGELLVRARGDNPRYGFFAGYLKNSEATAEAWRDGWLNTGDVVRAGSDGSLYFVDRRKNVIRRSGENISALEVESVLVQQPAVDLAIAIAVPDELRGDEVMALIILAAGQQPSRQLAEQIVTTALQGLAYYKVPGFVAFVSELPMTASQKPRRADIKALGQQLHSSGDCFDTCALKKRQPSATAASRSPL